MDLSEPGLGDFVLLGQITEEAFMENLQLRFSKDRIYTFIGNVIVSVNPYKKINIYTPELIEKYRSTNMYELPPHIFSVADDAYRNMRDRNVDQCILITGESGAGKTEASKIIMKYIAAVSGSSVEVDRVKDQLLNSNPVLEAFGNAKTTRNDNSSRFGKYMDLQFDYKGDPIGGVVTNYLLEKSRVVYQGEGERNFHIFYQVLRGADDGMRQRLQLSGDPRDYHYTNQSGSDTVKGMDDHADFQEVLSAMKTVGFESENIDYVLQVVAGILHLGNVQFTPNGDDKCTVANMDVLKACATMFGVSPDQLAKALTSRTVKDSSKGGQDVLTPLSVDKAAYSRDALAKSTYDRLFSWVVKKINENIYSKEAGRRAVIGVLDIYGFEILAKNSFEQFCINYCNEKLQQIFIELTLKLEQEEYQREGIVWTPIDYFNNAIICKLIEDRTTGIIDKLDEECLRPGEATTETLMTKLNSTFSSHPHYVSRETARSDKSLGPHDFRLKHYAGDVQYSADGFIDKNKDLLFKDLMHCMHESTNQVVLSVFPESASQVDLKRPDSAGTQFRASMDQLMKNLLSKNPHYVRCIKPNDRKASDLFQSDMCLHQVRYLGLLENVRVKRAGFCFRQKYEKFYERYKMLSKETWPNARGSARDASLAIMQAQGLVEAEYQMGKTKIFVRNPLTLFQLESDRNTAKHRLATAIKARFLAHMYRKRYQRMRAAVTTISANFRCYAARQEYKKTRAAAIVVAAIVRGFIARCRYRVLQRQLPKHAAPYVQRATRTFLRRRFLLKLAKATKEAGDNWRAVKWPAQSDIVPQFHEASQLLFAYYQRHKARQYRNRLTPERKLLLEEKLCASELFRGKRKDYDSSVGNPFKGDQLGAGSSPHWAKAGAAETEKIIVAFAAGKRHRASVKIDPRSVVLTNEAVHNLTALKQGLKPKARIPLANITGISLSNGADGVMVLHVQNEKKGDLILIAPSGHDAIEFAVRLYRAAKEATKQTIKITASATIDFNAGKGPVTKITFQDDASVQELTFRKDSNTATTCLVPSGAPPS